MIVPKISRTNLTKIVERTFNDVFFYFYYGASLDSLLVVVRMKSPHVNININNVATPDIDTYNLPFT